MVTSAPIMPATYRTLTGHLPTLWQGYALAWLSLKAKCDCLDAYTLSIAYPQRIDSSAWQAVRDCPHAVTRGVWHVHERLIVAAHMMHDYREGTVSATSAAWHVYHALLCHVSEVHSYVEGRRAVSEYDLNAVAESMFRIAALHAGPSGDAYAVLHNAAKVALGTGIRTLNTCCYTPVIREKRSRDAYPVHAVRLIGYLQGPCTGCEVYQTTGKHCGDCWACLHHNRLKVATARLEAVLNRQLDYNAALDAIVEYSYLMRLYTGADYLYSLAGRLIGLTPMSDELRG